MVTVMKLEKAPQETYADIGGLDSQIQEIKVIKTNKKPTTLREKNICNVCVQISVIADYNNMIWNFYSCALIFLQVTISFNTITVI